MKNTKYFPFERNKYFYGKLLSVDDFELEQRYGNDKRRMLNRFLQGSGVVAGLYAVRLDERTLSVEKGFALDALGREIVVDAPVICKLQLLEGYASCVEESGKDYVYLCLDYEEEESGIVHNIAGNAMHPDESEAYNRIRETYRLYVTDEEPEQGRLDQSALYEQERTLYAQDGVKIKLAAPKYVEAGGAGELRLFIENLSKTYLSFSFRLALEYMDCEGKSAIAVNFNEMQFEKTGSYELSYEVEAADLPGALASVHVEEKSAKLFFNKEPREFAASDGAIAMQIRLIQEDIRSCMVRDYYKTAMENLAQNSGRERLYLAKIYLLRTGDGCAIDRIENLPFGQYILNQNLSFALHQLTMEGGGVPAARERRAKEQKGINGQGQPPAVRFAQGSVWLDLSGGGQRGDRFLSDEIPHGLGLGNVSMQAGLEGADGAVTYGSSEIFADMDVMLEVAVRTFPERGTFQIGARLREPAIKSGVTVHWLAVKREEEKEKKKLVRKIFIRPGVLELAVRESHYLEAVCTNMEDTSVVWSVQGQGGTMSENGLYTAPNTPGVYEVVAESVAYPDVKASIFVVVREA